MAISLTTPGHITDAIAGPSNSAFPPTFNSYPSQLSISPQLLRFGFRSSFAFSSSSSCVLSQQSTVRAVSALQQPDSFGLSDKYYGGGKYVPQTLIHSLSELESAFKSIPTDHEFQKELYGIISTHRCRESPLYFAKHLTEYYKRPSCGEGPEIYFKREVGGLHRINNAVAQVLLAKKLGKKRVIADINVGEHGVETSIVCRDYGLQCIVYIAAQEKEYGLIGKGGKRKPGKKAVDLHRMKHFGAEVRVVDSDATSEAIRDWVTNPETTHYIIGSVEGPHPYPMMVREFHGVIGKATRKQAMEEWGGKPDVLVAFVGGDTNAMGLFNEFVEDKQVRLIGVEAAGVLLDIGKHATILTQGEVGVGAMTYLLQEDGQIIDLLSISAELGHSGVGSEHNTLKDLGRAECYSITDVEAVKAKKRVAGLEGFLLNLETCHAMAYLEKLCPTLAHGTKVVVNCSR